MAVKVTMLFSPDDKDGTYLLGNGIYLQVHMVSQPRTP
jgi:hypothetical protein